MDSSSNKAGEGTKSGSPSPSDQSSAGDKLEFDTVRLELEDKHGSCSTFEDLLSMCGDAGKWQLEIFLLASFVGFTTALHNLSYAFIGAAPPHHCKLPTVLNMSLDDVTNVFIPLDSHNEYEMCIRYNIPDDNNGVPWNAESLANVTVKDTISCDAYDYNQDIFKSTVVTEFDLVCNSKPWASVVQSIFMIGILVGSPIFGSISDKFGRRRAIWISSATFIIAGPLVAVSPNFPFLMVSRFILGMATPGIYATAFVLAVETVGLSWRGVVGNLFCLPFAFGYMTLPGVAYFFRDWRMLQLMLSVPAILQLVVVWLIPESPRWLLTNGSSIDAEDVLRNAARTNGVGKRLPQNFDMLVKNVARLTERKPALTEGTWLKRVSESVSAHAQLFQTPKLRRRTLALYIIWLSISMVYYGVALNSPNLSADRYLYTFISGVLEIPSYLMVPPLIKYFGRRKMFSAFLLFAGGSLLSSLFFTQGSVSIIALALFGKLLIGAAYALIYLYATELMPTLLRTFGVGSASMVGRVGSASAPFIVDLMGEDNKALPTMLFGVVSLTAGCIALTLPETKNKRLPETVEDVEENRC